MLRQMIRPPTLSSPRVAVRKHHHEMVALGTAMNAVTKRIDAVAALLTASERWSR